MPRCVAPYCDSTPDSGHGLFTFPKDARMCKIWLENMNRKSAREPYKLWKNSAYSRLCGLHFAESCFVVSPTFAKSIGFKCGRLQLKSDSVPTIFKRRPTTESKERKTRPGSEKRRRKKLVEEIWHQNIASGLPVLQPIATNAEENSAHVEVVAIESVTETVIDQVPVPATTSTIIKTKNQKVQTPLRWSSKIPVKIRSSSTQTNKVQMVDKGTQYDPPVEMYLPSTPSVHYDDIGLEQSFRSDDAIIESDGDSDYLPDMEYMEESDDKSETDSATEVIVEEDLKKERKYIVFESSLVNLLKKCERCGEEATVYKKYTKGTLVVFESVCKLNSEHRRTWQNQECLSGLPVGNLLLAGAILFSGSSPVKVTNVLKFLRIESFCLRTYYNLQKAYLLPAIDYVWSDEQYSVLSNVSEPLKVGGDARCCSPGHTAKYGSYTLMDLETSKILDIKLVQSSEVSSSSAMELEGLKRCLQTIEEEGLTISDITTDRHPQVRKFIREKHPEMRHWFDVWHVSKAVKKKVDAASRLKDCGILLDWSQSISNHLYYCAASSKGDGELLVEMWTSITNHVANVHEGHGLKFTRCQHDELQDRAWIKKDSKPHKELKEVIEKKHLLKDIKKLSPAEQTYSLESFHSICCFFATKFVHFFYQSMEGRLKLAGLHYNENSERPQDVTQEGKHKWSVSFPKYKKGNPVAKEVKVAATYNYVDLLLDEVIERRKELPSYRKSFCELELNIASTPKPVCAKYGKFDKEEIIAAHRSRFNSKNW